MSIDLKKILSLKKGIGKHLISYSSRGEDLIRIKPTHINFKYSKTRELNKNKFKVLMSFVKLIRKDIIHKIWVPWAKNINYKKENSSFLKMRRTLSGAALFMKENMDRFDGNLQLIDQEKIQISIGDLYPPENLKAEYDADDNDMLNITYKPYTGIDKSMKNHFLGGIAITENDYIVFDLPEAKREFEHASLKIANLDGQKVRLFLYFQNSTKDKFSYSKTVLCEKGGT